MVVDYSSIPLPVVEGIEIRHAVGLPGYAVGDDGSVWSCRNRWRSVEWRQLRQDLNRRGYPYVSLQLGNSRQKCRLVSHLVLEAFAGPRPAGQEACHDPDPNPLNNNRVNLQWGTRRDNVADMIAHGRAAFGLKNPRAKLNAAGVLLARQMLAAGLKQRAIAAQLGVKQGTISYLCRGRTYKDVTEAT